jgi:hypothetical protein
VQERSAVAFDAHRIFGLDYIESLLRPFVVEERRFIVGRELRDQIERPAGDAVALFELVRPAGATP